MLLKIDQELVCHLSIQHALVVAAHLALLNKNDRHLDNELHKTSEFEHQSAVSEEHGIVDNFYQMEEFFLSNVHLIVLQKLLDLSI